MENFFVIDVEADLYEQAPYNIGIVIANQKEIIEKRNIFMLNHMKENEKAMYAAENYAYFENNRKEFKCYDDDLEFTYDFLKLIQDYEIKKAYAYNIRFDWKKLEKLISVENLKNLIPCDIMTAAFYSIMDSKDYVDFCRQNDYKTAKGYPSATFETVYRFYTGNNEYKEIHRGLEDAIDEYDLLRRLGVKSQKGWKPIQPWRRMEKI